jgi:antitoxin component HigA of HigAB toxin-antitoxin module
MKLLPIKNNKEYQASLNWVDARFDKGVERNSTDGEDLAGMLLLIKAYEDKNCPIPMPAGA